LLRETGENKEKTCCCPRR